MKTIHSLRRKKVSNSDKVFWGVKGVLCSGVPYYVERVIMKDKGHILFTSVNPLNMAIVAVMSLGEDKVGIEPNTSFGGRESVLTKYSGSLLLLFSLFFFSLGEEAMGIEPETSLFGESLYMGIHHLECPQRDLIPYF